MVGCGCVVVLALAGALIYSVVHGIWLLAGGVAVVGVVGGFVGARALATRVRNDNSR